MSTPAGWYPDANGVTRWWDGYRWTDAVQPPVQQQPPAYQPQASYGQAPYGQATPAYPQAPAAAPASVAAGTSANTIWVWLVVLMPAVGLVGLMVYLGQLQPAMLGFIDGMPVGPQTADPGAIMRWESSMFAGMFTPWYLVLIVLGWAIYGLSVWFAYIDNKELRRRGFEQPFHWAWAFLSSLVWVIGRAVVVHRRGGRAYAPMWVAIAITVATIVVSTGWSIAFAVDFTQHMVSQIPIEG